MNMNCAIAHYRKCIMAISSIAGHDHFAESLRGFFPFVQSLAVLSRVSSCRILKLALKVNLVIQFTL